MPIITQDKLSKRFFLQNLAKESSQSGLKSWPVPNVYTFKDWMGNLWDTLLVSLGNKMPKIIDEFRETILWGEFVSKWMQREGKKLLNPIGTARTMRKCWKLLCQYNCLPALEGLTCNFEISPQDDWEGMSIDFWQELRGVDTRYQYRLLPDHRAFLELVLTYLEHMRNNFMISEQLQSNSLLYFLELYSDLPKLQEEELVFANFVMPAKQMVAFWEGLQRLGFKVKVENYHNRSKAKSSLLARLDNERPISHFDYFEDELNWAIKSSAELLQDPQREVAIAIPRLRSIFSEVQLTLDKLLSPQSLHLQGENVPRPYKFVQGDPILHLPFTCDLLSVLQLHSGGKLAKAKLLNVLQNGFVCGARSELSRRFALLKIILRDFKVEYDLEDLHQLAENNNCPLLAELTLWSLDTFKVRPRRGDLATWAQYSEDIIKRWFKYSRELKHSSQSARILSIVLQKIHKLTSLSGRYYSSELNFVVFLRYLRLVLHRSSLTPRPVEDSPCIYILDMSQVTKLNFTDIFLLNFSDRAFPQTKRNLGFIPQSFLVDIGWKYANSDICLRSCCEELDELLHCSENLQVSFSNFIEQNNYVEENKISPLWNYLDPVLTTVKSEESLLPVLSTLKTKDDEPPGPAQPNNLIENIYQTFRGGVDLINTQANCPFRAFAIYRLNCRDSFNLPGGLNSADKGQIIHALMQKIWQKINSLRREGESSRDKLRTLISSGDFKDIIADAIKITLSSERKKKLSEILTKNEAQRLGNILFNWFSQNEAERAENFNVAAMEKGVICYIPTNRERLPHFIIRGRIDRFDQILNGQEINGLLIDYKTGNSSGKSVKVWSTSEASKSVKDYQLPIYAVFAEENCRGIQFAKLSAQEQSLEELSLDNFSAKTSRSRGDWANDWPSQLEAWREKIADTANSFLHGDAKPIQSELCNTCHLKIICPNHQRL
ncbi:PD-(D/E)XK nuclease family protein [bacterium]|nr:PD-(D/E)XK nuclease family protein [bacterium]